MATKRPGHDRSLTIGDRLISAFMGGVCAFGTLALIWVWVLYYVGVGTGGAAPVAFGWVWGASGIVATISFFVGPERMLDGFAKVWGVIGVALFGNRR